MMCQNSDFPACRDIFLYLSVHNILISNGWLADKYKNMSLQLEGFSFGTPPHCAIFFITFNLHMRADCKAART